MPLSLPGSRAHLGRKLRPEVTRSWLPCPLQVLPGRLVSVTATAKSTHCPTRLPWGLAPVPLGLGETVHSTPNPAISHKSGPLPSPRPPTMSPKLQWQLQERPKVSLSLFQRKMYPKGPRNSSPEAWASLLGKLTHLSELGGRDSAHSPAEQRCSQWGTQPGAPGVSLVPTFFPQKCLWLTKVSGIQGQGGDRPSLTFCIAQSGEGDDRHITVSGTE